MDHTIGFLKGLFNNWEGRNQFLIKRFYYRRWIDKVNKLKQRDQRFNEFMKEMDKQFVKNCVNTIADASSCYNVTKSVPVARAKDFFTNLRRLWGDWDKIRKRILAIMGKYLESEDEKRINYLKRKLIQWKDNAREMTKEINGNRIAKWTKDAFKFARVRQNWKDLSNKYDMFVNKTALFQLKSRLRNWLKLRDMAEKMRNRLAIVGFEQFKEGIEFKKILVLMRSLFENWEERNKFLAKRFFIRKWFMQAKKLKQRDEALEESMKTIDKKLLQNSIINLTDALEIQRVCNTVPVARAVDFFTNLRRLWGDWDKVRRRILAIMGKYIESEDDKRINYLKRKLLQWKENAKQLTKEVAMNRIAKWAQDYYKLATAKKNWKDLSNKYDMFVNKTALFQLKQRLRNWLKLRDMAEKMRNRLTVVGFEQFKEGIEFKKILVLMRSLFENWEERNKFLAKRFFVRKWFMQVKKLKQRDDALDNSMKVIDKKLLENTVINMSDAFEIQRVCNAVSSPISEDYGEIGIKLEEEFLISWENILKVKMIKE